MIGPAEKYTALLAIVCTSAGLADLAAHRDEVASRRYRELYPATVASAADRAHNGTWHRLGLLQRLAGVVLLALLVYYWLDRVAVAGLLAAGLGGFVTMLVFDPSLNIRLGMPWDYTGTTAQTDVLAAGRGRRLAGLKGAGVVLGIIGWVLFV